MKTGPIIKRARERAGLTLRELGERIDRSASQLSVIENGHVVNPLSPVEMIEISDAVLDRQMLVEYCDSCLIRSRVVVKKFPPLNNIIPGAQIAILKVLGKLSAASETLDNMLPKMLNKNFVTDPDYREFRNKAILTLYEVQHGAATLFDQFVEDGIISHDGLLLLADIHQRTCEEHGHHVPEKVEG